jgi:hypothetical protein
MQRVRLGRISGVVTAVCLIGAVQFSEELYAMTEQIPDPESTVVPGLTTMRASDLGAPTRLDIPFAGGQWQFLGPLRCAFDARIQRENCVSKKPTDTTFAALTVEYRAHNGELQQHFDSATTASTRERRAFVSSGVSALGHETDVNVRSTIQTLFSESAESIVLSGADTTFKTVLRANGVNRLRQVVKYSGVVLPRNPSDVSRAYPLSGVLYAVKLHDWVGTSATRKMHTTAIVYFDGTRTPEAYLDGKRHKLDLRTGLATPVLGDN